MATSLRGGAMLAAGVGLFLSASASAAPNLITNGDFETTTLTSSHQFAGNQVAGWTNATTSGYTGYGYNFLVMPGAADTTGFGSNGGNVDRLWGPGSGPGSYNYSNNGMTATSPVGGNYLLMDGDSNFAGTVSQSVGGLTAGALYQLSFYYAGGSFAGNVQPTTETLSVSFGGTTVSTPTLPTPAMGFSPWRQATFNFVATAATQTLSFLAVGTPAGAPPTSLLDGVSLTAVPEPATWIVLLAAIGGLFAFKRYRGKTLGSGQAAA